jgi:putative ABC transport system substrate-binding protein
MPILRRRAFITLPRGAAVASPIAARGQQPDRVRRLGMLNNFAEGDRDEQAWINSFRATVGSLGWSEGRNLRLDTTRRRSHPSECYRRHATALVALEPDVLVGVTSPIVAALQRATRTVPIVFAGVIDPVGNGLVDRLARPGRQFHRVCLV